MLDPLTILDHLGRVLWLLSCPQGKEREREREREVVGQRRVCRGKKVGVGRTHRELGVFSSQPTIWAWENTISFLIDRRLFYHHMKTPGMPL